MVDWLVGILFSFIPFLFFFFFEAISGYIVQAGLEFAIYPRLISNSCLGLLSSGITETYHGLPATILSILIPTSIDIYETKTLQ